MSASRGHDQAPPHGTHHVFVVNSTKKSVISQGPLGYARPNLKHPPTLRKLAEQRHPFGQERQDEEKTRSRSPANVKTEMEQNIEQVGGANSWSWAERRCTLHSINCLIILLYFMVGNSRQKHKNDPFMAKL